MVNGIGSYEYNGAGYKPLVCSHNWVAALLNLYYEDLISMEEDLEIERHMQTDEVFTCLRAGLHSEDMFDTDIRPLTGEERQCLLGQLPGWLT